MPEPYNYGAQLKAVDPGQAMMQGLATGQQFFQIQQQEEQRQQMADKAQQFQIDFESIIDDKDPQAITDLLIRYPEQREILVAVGGRFSAEEKQQRMKQEKDKEQRMKQEKDKKQRMKQNQPGNKYSKISRTSGMH